MDDKEPLPKAASDIDENLRRVFKELEDPNLPDRFTDLLDRLREKDKAQGDRV